MLCNCSGVLMVGVVGVGYDERQADSVDRKSGECANVNVNVSLRVRVRVRVSVE